MNTYPTPNPVFTASIAIVLVVFMLCPQNFIHSAPAPSEEPVSCCGECHPKSCCKLVKQVEIMNACCSSNVIHDIISSPKLTLSDKICFEKMLLTPEYILDDRLLQCSEGLNPDIPVPPPRLCG